MTLVTTCIFIICYFCNNKNTKTNKEVVGGSTRRFFLNYVDRTLLWSLLRANCISSMCDWFKIIANLQGFHYTTTWTDIATKISFIKIDKYLFKIAYYEYWLKRFIETLWFVTLISQFKRHLSATNKYRYFLLGFLICLPLEIRTKWHYSQLQIFWQTAPKSFITDNIERLKKCNVNNVSWKTCYW